MTGFILSTPAFTAQSLSNTNTIVKVSQSTQDIFASYTLKWRQNILWVSPKANPLMSLPVPIYQLVDRLKLSPVRCVCLDAKLGEAHLKDWCEACSKAGKKLYVRAPKNTARNAIASQNGTVKRSLQQDLLWLGLPLSKAFS